MPGTIWDVSRDLYTRVLPVDEWSRLAGTELADVWPYLDSNRNQIVVVEREDVMVGTLVLMQALHAEFLWMAPEERGRVAVGRRLLTALRTEAHMQGWPTVLMAAMSSQMLAIVQKLGAEPLPGCHYVLSMKGAK
jgi:hypothetical protein